MTRIILAVVLSATLVVVAVPVRAAGSRRFSSGAPLIVGSGAAGVFDDVIIDDLQAPRRQRALADGALLLVGSPVSDCAPTTLSYNVDPESPMTVSASIQVHRSSVTEIQRALDPQNWDICSRFWTPPPRTYLATRSGSTVTEDPAVPSDEAYHHSFYEHFSSHVCTQSFFFISTCHDADFENMLDITSTPTSTGYRAEYRFLAPSVRAAVDNVPVTLTIDDGYIAAKPGPDAGTWIVEGRKMVQFANSAQNTWSQIAFGYGLKELATEMAELACCDVSAALATPTPMMTRIDSIPRRIIR